VKSENKNCTSYNGALGTVKKGLDQNLQLLPGHPSTTEDHITEQCIHHS